MKPNDAKIRVIVLSNDDDTNEKLDTAAKKKIEEWQKKHEEEIKKSSDAKQIEFDEIAHQAKKPEQISVKLEHNMTVPESDEYLPKHIFSDKEGVPYSTGKGKFFDSKWEEKVAKEEIKKESLKGWYRNGRGGEKSISVPYIMEGNYHQSQPDLIFVHEVDGELVADIYDPHNHALADTSYKWVGLAKYARDHSESYRHVKAVIEINDVLWCLDLKADGIDEKIAKATNKTAIENLFKSEGCKYKNISSIEQEPEFH